MGNLQDTKNSQPEQEPIGWASDIEFDSLTTFCSHEEKGVLGTAGLRIPLYTNPPQRTWQGLTNEEYERLHKGLYHGGKFLGWVVDEVEKILKEKNT